MIGSIRFGLCAQLVSDRANGLDFQIGLEHIQSGTGRLLEVDTDYSGQGIAFQPGDILFGKLRPYLAKAWLADRAGAAVGDFLVFRPRIGISARFLAYVLVSEAFIAPINAATKGAKMPRANWDTVKSHHIRLPEFTEQEAIADLLDHELASIDGLISRQEDLIEGLRERRSAIVDSAVWSGVTDGVEFAPTGLDIVPIAPVHWKRLRNKNIYCERTDVSETGSEELLTVSHITGVTPRSQKNVNMFEAESLEGYRLVHAGDLCINTMWAWMGAAGVSEFDGIVSPAYGVYAPRPGVEYHGRFFDYLIRTTPYITEMTRNSRGITSSRLRLYPEVFLRMATVLPPLEEQKTISAYLDEHTAGTDALIATAQQLIETAKERRAALITEAVTGRIDVPPTRKAA